MRKFTNIMCVHKESKSYNNAEYNTMQCVKNMMDESAVMDVDYDGRTNKDCEY